jgi:hypothetical protein
MVIEREAGTDTASPSEGPHDQEVAAMTTMTIQGAEADYRMARAEKAAETYRAARRQRRSRRRPTADAGAPTRRATRAAGSSVPVPGRR